MKLLSLAEELQGNSYPGRGIVLGQVRKTGQTAVSSLFLSWEEARTAETACFVEEGAGIRTQAFDPAKLVDPSLNHLCARPRPWK